MANQPNSLCVGGPFSQLWTIMNSLSRKVSKRLKALRARLPDHPGSTGCDDMLSSCLTILHWQRNKGDWRLTKVSKSCQVHVVLSKILNVVYINIFLSKQNEVSVIFVLWKNKNIWAYVMLQVTVSSKLVRKFATVLISKQQQHECLYFESHRHR